MRKLNAAKLKAYLAVKGKLAKETLAVETGITIIKLDRMIRGSRNATKPEMMALCSVTGFAMDELFPIFDDEKESA